MHPEDYTMLFLLSCFLISVDFLIILVQHATLLTMQKHTRVEWLEKYYRLSSSNPLRQWLF